MILTLAGLGGALATATTGYTDAPVLFGYDVVEYFNLKEGGEGVVGDSQYSANITASDLSNATNKMLDTEYMFYFKDQTNLDKFKNDPWKYAPKYGGF